MHRLIIADDSPVYRLRLSQIFSASDSLQLVGLAGDGQEAVRLVQERRPDVLVLDLEMPVLDGFSVLRWAMKHAPLPVVVCSGRSEHESVFQALEAGAVDFISKPELRFAIRSQNFAEHLRSKVEAAAVAHAHATLPRGTDERAAIAAVKHVRETKSVEERVGLVAIVGSAGSPAAVAHVLSHLDKNFRGPVIIALHMPQGFTSSFAERLSRNSPFSVTEAQDGEALAETQVYVAPGGQHTSVIRDEQGELRFRIEASDASDFYAPSADRLLETMAGACGAQSLAVVLTGMGEDGLRGARAVRERGGHIIVESRETAVIWGMPRAVSEAGLADAELTPAAIAAALPLLCIDSQ